MYVLSRKRACLLGVEALLDQNSPRCFPFAPRAPPPSAWHEVDPPFACVMCLWGGCRVWVSCEALANAGVRCLASASRSPNAATSSLTRSFKSRPLTHRHRHTGGTFFQQQQQQHHDHRNDLQAAAASQHQQQNHSHCPPPCPPCRIDPSLCSCSY